MDGPRGSLVIALLFFIAGQLAFIAGALVEGPGLFLGFVMTVFSVLAFGRVIVELLRKGAEQGRRDSTRPRPKQGRAHSIADPEKRRRDY